METISINTPRLFIRNLQLKDLDAFHSYRSQEAVMLYQGSDIMNKAQAKEFILDQKDKQFGKAGKWVQYAIENKAIGILIGDCAIKLQETDPRIAEIGMTISPVSQRKGFGKEAFLAITAFLFDTKKIHRIVETVDAENTASIRLLQSTGFREEGYFIENIFFNGKWGSEYQYAMLRTEWEGRKNTN